MNLIVNYATKNKCFIEGMKASSRQPEGIIVHSTGANNVNLKRYCHNDADNRIGENTNGNHRNQYQPGGKSTCAHAFVGMLESNGGIATCQLLPWSIPGWHCSGTGNQTHIGFEICEDDLKSEGYFHLAMSEAIALCAYLCKAYSIPIAKVISHKEAHALGLANNHADIDHWLKIYGLTMNDFREAVRKQIDNEDTEIIPEQMFYVRKKPFDKKTQIGAFKNLDYARAFRDAHNEYSIFDKNGQLVT